MSNERIPRVLTIAGSDSGGGAGIEADLKTMSALGVYAMAAITSVTAQNTVGVFGVHDLPPEFVARQIDVVANDIGVDTAKTGMLSNAAIVDAVAQMMEKHAIKTVVDPVMVAKSGDALLQPVARNALIDRLLPLAFMVTPNVPEAEVIAEMPIRDAADMRYAAEKIRAFGPQYVLMKGGHLTADDATDYLYDGESFVPFTSARIDTRNTHGTGCTFSAAIASYLARGFGAAAAVEAAKSYLSRAIEASLDLGEGHGPLNHGWSITPPVPESH